MTLPDLLKPACPEAAPRNGGPAVVAEPLPPAVSALKAVPPGLAEELRRLARGWRRTLEVCERLKKLDGGRPLLELVKD